MSWKKLTNLKNDLTKTNLIDKIDKKKKKYALFVGLATFAALNTGFTDQNTNEIVEQPVKVQEAVEVAPSDEMKMLITQESKSLPSGITVSDNGGITLAENDTEKNLMADVVSKTLTNIDSVENMQGLTEGEAIEEPEYIEEVEEVKHSEENSNVPYVSNVYDYESSYASMMAMEATAYLPTDGNGAGITAMGIPATYGVAAVDPNVIPLGSRLYVPGYGEAIAADTGGAIYGYRIDLCMESYEQAMNFGRRTITVYVLR